LVRQTRQQQVELTPLHYVNGQRIMTSELVSPIQALAQGNSAATGDGSAATLFGHIERQTSREYHMHSGSNQSPETLPNQMSWWRTGMEELRLGSSLCHVRPAEVEPQVIDEWGSMLK
jgi:hypothetical protein